MLDDFSYPLQDMYYYSLVVDNKKYVVSGNCYLGKTVESNSHQKHQHMYEKTVDCSLSHINVCIARMSSMSY